MPGAEVVGDDHNAKVMIDITEYEELELGSPTAKSRTKEDASDLLSPRAIVASDLLDDDEMGMNAEQALLDVESGEGKKFLFDEGDPLIVSRTADRSGAADVPSVGWVAMELQIQETVGELPHHHLFLVYMQQHKASRQPPQYICGL